jgi:hypothetical protein
MGLMIANLPSKAEIGNSIDDRDARATAKRDGTLPNGRRAPSRGKCGTAFTAEFRNSAHPD